MSLEGKMMGYNKKTVVIAIVAVILAVVVFYAGAEYEKNKMIRLGLCKGGSAQSSAAAGTIKKHKKKDLMTPGTGTTAPTQGTASGTDTTSSTAPSQPTNATAPATSNAPTAQTPATGATN